MGRWWTREITTVVAELYEVIYEHNFFDQNIPLTKTKNDLISHNQTNVMNEQRKYYQRLSTNMVFRLHNQIYL